MNERNAESGAPFRLCCGERHHGPVCPDSKVMCCMCFERFAQEDLAYDEEIQWRIDVCKPCWERDRASVTPPGGDQ